MSRIWDIGSKAVGSQVFMMFQLFRICHSAFLLTRCRWIRLLKFFQSSRFVLAGKICGKPGDNRFLRFQLKPVSFLQIVRKASQRLFCSKLTARHKERVFHILQGRADITLCDFDGLGHSEVN